jgi:hypothetical protein
MISGKSTSTAILGLLQTGPADSSKQLADRGLA